jgi:hypothetical protein
MFECYYVTAGAPGDAPPTLSSNKRQKTNELAEEEFDEEEEEEEEEEGELDTTIVEVIELDEDLLPRGRGIGKKKVQKV